MSKAKFEAARELIQEKKYDEARAVLKSMLDEPRAIEWLAKLEQLAPSRNITALPAVDRDNRPKRRMIPILSGMFLFAIGLASGLLIARFAPIPASPGASVATAPTSIPTTPAPSTTLAVNAPSALQEMFIKHGLTLRYPAGWKTDDQFTSLTVSAPDQTGQAAQIIILSPRYGATTDGPTIYGQEICKNERLKQKGLVGSDGRAILKPNGDFLSVAELKINGLEGYSCGYRSENTILKAALLKLTGTDRIEVIGISNDAVAFDSIFDQMVQSLQIDMVQIGDWGRVTKNTAGNPVPLGQPAILMSIERPFKVTIDKVLRGPEAARLVSTYDYSLDPGEEFILIHANVERLNYGEDKELTLIDLFYKILSKGQILDDKLLMRVSPPTPRYSFDLYPGRKAAGWLVRVVPTDDPSPLLVYDEIGDPVYFALK